MIETLGNTEVMKLRKTAFLCSRTVGCEAVMHCYDWAAEKARRGEVVVSGFQSKIERDVLHFLLKGKQPIILVIARRMYNVLPTELKQPLDEGRLLIISTAPKATRTSTAAAKARNEYIATIADKIVFGYIAKGSSLEEIYQRHKEKTDK